MHPLIERLFQEIPVLTDGAWGTELQSRGLPVGELPDIWNLTQPEKVYSVAKSYVDAGSRIILTNTFGANRIRLREIPGYEDKAMEINRAGVGISKDAAGNGVFVFASIGPSGKLLMSGDVTAEELQIAFEEQASAIASAGADGIVVETMSDLEEALIAVKAAKATGLPVVACMVFDSGKDRDRTMMGNTPEEVAKSLIDAGADVVGSNCGQGIESFHKICKRLYSVSSRPVWAKPNAGLPVMENGKVIYKINPDDFAKYALGLLDSGAGFIGGCCGTNPQFISALRGVISNK